MKKIIFLVVLLTVFDIVGVCANAYTISWVNESRDYNAGEVVGSWQVLQYKDAVIGNSNNVWTTTGFWDGNYESYPSSLMWCYQSGPTASVTFEVQSTAIAFMLQSDWNDGLANFYVDGVPVLSNFDMLTLPNMVMEYYPLSMIGTLVVSDLTYGYHTIKIEAAGWGQSGDDVHFFGGAAMGALSVPEPNTMILLGLGLIGLAGIKRKI